jgi:hypothetical protein
VKLILQTHRCKKYYEESIALLMIVLNDLIWFNTLIQINKFIMHNKQFALREYILKQIGNNFIQTDTFSKISKISFNISGNNVHIDEFHVGARCSIILDLYALTF